MVTIRDDVRRIARTSGFALVSPSLLAGYSLHDAILGYEPTSPEAEALRDRWVKQWAGAVLRIFGIRVFVVGAVNTSSVGHFVVSNHRGVADILVLLRTFGGRMVSRADLSKWPFIGMAGRKLGTVFVDRASTTSGAGAIRAIRDLLCAGATVTIFPEGTTFAGDEVRPFHKGGLAAAVGTDARIVPVGLAYSRDSHAAFLDETFPAHLSRMAAAPPSFVVVSVGEPFDVPAKTRSVKLAELAREAVVREVTRARAEANRHEKSDTA